MMDKKFFQGQMEIFAGAYRDSRFVSDLALNAWYKFFKYTKPEHFEQAVAEWVETETAAPTVAGIKDVCLKIRLKEASCV